MLPLQVVGDEIVELLLSVAGDELFDQRDPIGEWNIFEHLAPQRALAYRF